MLHPLFHWTQNFALSHLSLLSSALSHSMSPILLFLISLYFSWLNFVISLSQDDVVSFVSRCTRFNCCSLSSLSLFLWLKSVISPQMLLHLLFLLHRTQSSLFPHSRRKTTSRVSYLYSVPFSYFWTCVCLCACQETMNPLSRFPFLDLNIFVFWSWFIGSFVYKLASHTVVWWFKFCTPSLLSHAWHAHIAVGVKISSLSFPIVLYPISSLSCLTCTHCCWC